MEEGLGAGVRRVLGVTADKAVEAFAEAAKLHEAVKAAEALSGKELTAAVAALVQQLEKATAPAADRIRINEAIGALRKKVAAGDKEAAKAAAGAAKAEAEAIATAAAEGAPIIKLLQAEADAKALEPAVKAIEAKCPTSPILLLGVGKTLAGLAVVPASLQEQLSAKDWVNEALQVAGGKGGGKPARAQGAARDPSKAAEAEAAAKAFAAAKLSIEIS
jgi:alanyl-tRNA synthetase